MTSLLLKTHTHKNRRRRDKPPPPRCMRYRGLSLFRRDVALDASHDKVDHGSVLGLLPDDEEALRVHHVRDDFQSGSLGAAAAAAAAAAAGGRVSDRCWWRSDANRPEIKYRSIGKRSVECHCHGLCHATWERRTRLALEMKRRLEDIRRGRPTQSALLNLSAQKIACALFRRLPQPTPLKERNRDRARILACFSVVRQSAQDASTRHRFR